MSYCWNYWYGCAFLNSFNVSLKESTKIYQRQKNLLDKPVVNLTNWLMEHTDVSCRHQKLQPKPCVGTCSAKRSVLWNSASEKNKKSRWGHVNETSGGGRDPEHEDSLGPESHESQGHLRAAGVGSLCLSWPTLTLSALWPWFSPDVLSAPLETCEFVYVCLQQCHKWKIRPSKV